MKYLRFLLITATFLTAFGYLYLLVPKQTTVQPEPIMADQRITVHIEEQDEPVNVYTDKIPLSNGWQCYLQDTCRRYNVPYALMLGLIETESSFQSDADSGWAYGLCQIGYINEDWLSDQGINMYTIQGNIEAGCLILSDYLSRYTTEQALICYNEGEYGAADTFADGVYSTKYSRSVLESAEKWRSIINGIN